MRNPYTVLGVAQTADEKQIKSAFRKLAMRYHPDHNQKDASAQQKFSEINQAYEILGDKQKRAAFDSGEIDAEGKPRFQGGFGAGSGGRTGGASFDFDFGGGNFHNARSAHTGGFDGNIHLDESVFSDLFSQAGFGRQRGRTQQAPQRGGDINAALDLSLQQILGTEKVEVAFSNGKKLKIKLPPYLENGQTIRLKGQGGAGSRGGLSGDALISVRFKPDSRFRVEERALHTDLQIPLKTAILGGKEMLETLDGTVAVTISPWVNADKILRLKDRGLPLKEGGRAPLYVHIHLTLPREPDEKLKKWAEKQK